MNWLGLSPLEVVALWSAAGALALWLYLHNRRPTRRRVSTLRFWVSVQPVSQPRRRRLREPLALLAQLLFLLLLILALANLHWGSLFEGRSVVMVLDTSIWTQARPAGQPPWIDQVRQQARRFLDTLPASDRVLLLPAEAGSPPIVPFTTDHATLQRALAELRPSMSVADVPRALEMGKAALADSRRGLLIYVGPGMLGDQQTKQLDEFRHALQTPAQGANPVQFLARLVGGQGPVQDRGITRLSLRRDDVQPDRWHLLTQLKNYTERQAQVTLNLSIGGQLLGQREISLGPNQLANEEDNIVSAKGGLLQAEIGPSDDLSADDRAVLNLPSFQPVRVAVFTIYSPFAVDLLTALSSNPYLQTEIVVPGMTPQFTPDVSIYQGVGQAIQPDSNSIIFVKGQASASSGSLRITEWNTQHPVTRWVHTRDISVRNPASLQVRPGDVVLASAAGNPPVPLILARKENGHRILIIGFDPHDSNFTLQSAFPLLMAGGIDWMTHPVVDEVEAFAVGELDLPGPASRIVSPSGQDVPFARKGSDLHLLARETGLYRVFGANGEESVAVNAPVLPSQRWVPTATESAPAMEEPMSPAGRDLWWWLAALALVALWLEWWLFYSRRKGQQATEFWTTPGPVESLRLDQELPRNPDQPETRHPNFVS
jgi:Ca-activated chloride channel family protein